VLHSFGSETLAIANIGRRRWETLREYLENCGYPVSIVPIKNEIRTNFTVTDRQGLTVNLNEAGPVLSKTEVTRFERAVREALERASWLMLCGSIPPSVPASFYARLVALARQKKVRTLLHANGEALREDCPSGPRWSHRINTKRTPARPRAADSQPFPEAAEEIRTLGPESVVLSLGSRGAVRLFRMDWWKLCLRRYT